MPYLIRRRREGITDSMQPLARDSAQGYVHSTRTVCRFITRLRRAAEAARTLRPRPTVHRPQGASARAVSFTWLCPEAKPSQDAQTYIDQLTEVDPSIAQAYQLSQAFLVLVRERRGDELDAVDDCGDHSGSRRSPASPRLAGGLAASKRGPPCPGAIAPSNGRSPVEVAQAAKAMGARASRLYGGARCRPP